MQFPINGEHDREVDSAARTVLAALALCALTLSHKKGYHLRSGCDLVPTEKFQLVVPADPDDDIPARVLSLKVDDCKALFAEAVANAKKIGLPWEGVIRLEPSPALVELVRKSADRYGNGKEAD